MAVAKSIPVKPQNPVIAQILKQRGFSDDQMEIFLSPDYDRDIHDPFLMTDMEPAVDRIVLAAERGEQVAVYGDYDIDGITASAVLTEGLAAQGIVARSYIPDRFEEGYGINLEALRYLKSEGIDLVVSVDCGITSLAEAAWASEHGLDLIITDHHSVPAEIPSAVAVINPHRPDDKYPFKDLCGAGVAFKLVQALQHRTGRPASGQEKWLLDLVALGTVCDVVPLVGENRVLVSYGLKVMRQTRRAGIRALANVGEIDIAEIGSRHLGFVLGPRLNAAGRLEHASRSLQLLQTASMPEAVLIAEELDILNRQRRTNQEMIVKQALAQASDFETDPILVLADPEWSHGVVGIAASKLSERLNKPTLVAQTMGVTTKGSARSRNEFNMVEALRNCDDLLIKYGGHFYAAGFTLPTERLGEFRERLNEYYRKHYGANAERPVVSADVTLGSLGDIDWPLLEDLALLEPYGAGNIEPLLEINAAVRQIRRIGKDSSHLKLVLGDYTGSTLDGIGFGLAERLGDVEPGQDVCVVGSLNKNEYQGRASLQLNIQDIRYE